MGVGVGVDYGIYLYERIEHEMAAGQDLREAFYRAMCQRGTAAVVGAEADFRTGVQWALRYAEALDCPRIHCMAGLLPEGASAYQISAASSVYESNLRWAAAQAAAAGREILIEPINPRDIPRFFLNRQDDAHAIVQKIGAPNLKVQFDLYHCQIVEGDLATRIRQYLDYKAWKNGIIVIEVHATGISTNCARCGAEIIRTDTRTELCCCANGHQTNRYLNAVRNLGKKCLTQFGRRA